MEDKILVILNEDANHTFESDARVIGRVGEGGIAKFEITIPKKLTGGSLYLDFRKPNGEKIRTKRLDINEGKAVYDVEKYLLTDDGEIKVQAVVVTSSGKTWKSSKKKYNILKSINAVHDIPDEDKEDFLIEAEKVVLGYDSRLKALEEWNKNPPPINAKDVIVDYDDTTGKEIRLDDKLSGIAEEVLRKLPYAEEVSV